MNQAARHTVSPKDWEEIERLFQQCRRLPQTDRLLLLSRETRDKSWMRQELESLLEANDSTESPLDDPLRSSLMNLAKDILPVPTTVVSSSSLKARKEAPPPFQPGQVGKYFLLERLGAGGMAEVFRAKLRGARGFEKFLAVKRILPQYCEDAEFCSLFEFEAKLSSQLTHANIVQVQDFVKIGENYFLAMEYVDGQNLSQVIERLKGEELVIPVECAVFIVSEICKGLDYAHSRLDDRTHEPLHIVHRDISPKNIMISYQGEIKIVDFGIAKARDRASMTHVGDLRGTLSYMSPEQARGEAIDHRSDIYATGAVLFELLSGRPLFPTHTGALTLVQLIAEGERPMSAVEILDVHPELKKILRKSLTADLSRRYSNANSFQRDLQSYLNQNCDPQVQKAVAEMMREAFPEEIKSGRNTIDLEEPDVLRLEKRKRAAPPAFVTRDQTATEPALIEKPSKVGLLIGLMFIVTLSGFVVWWLLDRNSAIVEAPRIETKAPKTEESLPEGTCEAVIVTSPSGASAYVNGIFLGKTPSTVRLACERSVELRLELEGQETFSRKFVVNKKRSRIELSFGGTSPMTKSP